MKKTFHYVVMLANDEYELDGYVGAEYEHKVKPFLIKSKRYAREIVEFRVEKVSDNHREWLGLDD